MYFEKENKIKISDMKQLQMLGLDCVRRNYLDEKL